MAQDFGTPIQPISQPKRNNTPIIIAVVALVVLCCCCLIVLGAWAALPALQEIWYTYSLSFTPWLARLF